MRVLGFYRGEVAVLLLGELAVFTFVAIPVGCVLGYLFAAGMVSEFASDLFRLPLIVEPSTYAYAAIVVIISALLSGAMVARRVARLDLIAVLKTRD
jgi:putative ABC transport system permease protein